MTVATQTSTVPLTTPARAETRTFLVRELARGIGAEEVLVLSVPAPVAAPEALLAGVDQNLAVVWDPPGDESFAGLGAAERIDLDGPERFAELREKAAELFARLHHVVHPGAAAFTPRFFGGFAFDVGAASKAPWSELGDGCFTLPRLAYARRNGVAVLSLAVAGWELASAAVRERAVEELEDALARLEHGTVGRSAPPRVIRIEHQNDGFTAEVEAIRAEILAGRFDKIVAARRSRVELDAPLDNAAVLERLGRGLVASTRFAFCRDNTSFLGATPERLVALRGRELETEALAGSIAAGQAAKLLESGKDQREHRLVVDSIVRRLEPLCQTLEVAPEPRVRALREVLHLHTPIRGTLAEPRHVLELVEALHPTPAVGGVPTRDAMRWIAEHEEDERGWYAAPVGWFDAAGNGEFAVALRSCVLAGREAYLYAGAGIVQGSDPELEDKEIELKKRALLEALGA